MSLNFTTLLGNLILPETKLTKAAYLMKNIEVGDMPEKTENKHVFKSFHELNEYMKANKLYKKKGK